MKWLLVLSLCLLTTSSYCKKKGKKRRGKKPRVVNVDFDDELHIKGKLLGPSIFSLFQKKDLNYGRLIKPRENFLPEMRRTLEDIE